MRLIRNIDLVLLHAGVVLGQARRLAVSLDAADIKSGTPLDGFLSYSIEFASFPDFAGEYTHTFALSLIAITADIQFRKHE